MLATSTKKARPLRIGALVCLLVSVAAAVDSGSDFGIFPVSFVLVMDGIVLWQTRATKTHRSP